MPPDPQPNDVIAAAEALIHQGVPIAPYWEGRTFDASLHIPLRKPYSREEWDSIFAQLTALLTDQEDKDGRGESTRSAAISRLREALQAEQRQAAKDSHFLARSPATRLLPIFAIITAAAGTIPHLFEDFCFEFAVFADQAPYNHLFLAWLEQLAKEHMVGEDELLAARLLFHGFGKDWATIGDRLIATLDHADLKVRAIAASILGTFCRKAVHANRPADHPDYDVDACQRARQETAGMPTVQEVFRLIQRKELARPGVAGAFWSAVPHNLIDEREWLLSLLIDAPSPEPYIRGFAINLAFEAHERFSQDLDAIRRLMDAGRTGVAVAAATEHDRNVPELEPILMELGLTSDPHSVRQTSWHLAYYYHCLHPRGAELGFVKQLEAHPALDIYLLFSDPDTDESPYAVILYPQHRQPVTQAEAQTWVDQIFPPAVRGEFRPNLSPFSTPLHAWYQRGYVEFHTGDRSIKPDAIDIDRIANSVIVRHVIIGYRSDVLWNPTVLI